MTPIIDELEVGVIRGLMADDDKNEQRGPPPLVPAPHLGADLSDSDLARVFLSPNAQACRYAREIFSARSEKNADIMGARDSQATITVEVSGLQSTLNPNAR